MIVLWLLVAHLTGDYLLQTRWQANGKFGWDRVERELRIRHCAGYAACFAPVAVWYAPNWPAALMFMVLLFAAHFLTDAQRFTRTPGEWLWWHVLGGDTTDPEKRGVHAAMGADTTKFDLPPNPWKPISLAIDQTLHLIQIAVLAELLLT